MTDAEKAILPTADQDTEALDFGKKKKKKKVKEELLESETKGNAEEGGEGTTEGGEKANEEGDLVFGKKKKSKGKVMFDEEKNVEFEDNEAPVSAQPESQTLLSESDGGSNWIGSERDYTYEELLARVFNIMREKNPDMITGEKKKFVMKPPQVSRVGTKRTSFTNFAEICKLLRRQEKHLLNFLLVELGTSGSLDINKQLIIKGKFQQKQIENVLRRYIKEYVTCHTCRSPETNLVKEERLFFLKCEACGATCSVASIKSGFQAQVGKRAAIRARAT